MNIKGRLVCEKIIKGSAVASTPCETSIISHVCQRNHTQKRCETNSIKSSRVS